jgi:hypothetical protein
LKHINRRTVLRYAGNEIQKKYQEALELLQDNLDNITEEAIKYRNKP